MRDETLAGFVDELMKLSGKQDIVNLLKSKALKVGLNAERLPSIKQVGTLAESGNRDRAAAIAMNVRKSLKAKAPTP